MAQASESSTPELIRKKIGQIALQAKTMSEEQAIKRLDYLDGYEWPENFKVTTVSATTGEFAFLGKDSNIKLKDGVASSCALPGVLPPVTINNDRYVDGGVRSMVNADLAAGYNFVIVVSCFSLEISLNNTSQDILNKGLLSEVDILRKSGSKVKVISPNSEFLKLTKEGTDMFNLTLMPESWQVGRRQAVSEKDDVDSPWYLEEAEA